MSKESLADYPNDRSSASFQKEDFKVLVEQNLDYIKINSSNYQ